MPKPMAPNDPATHLRGSDVKVTRTSVPRTEAEPPLDLAGAVDPARVSAQGGQAMTQQLPPKPVGKAAEPRGSDLPPAAVDPNAKPAPKARPSAHERTLAKVPERLQPRYRDVAKLVEKIATDHAAAAVAAAGRGEEPPRVDAELVAGITAYSITGRMV